MLLIHAAEISIGDVLPANTTHLAHLISNDRLGRVQAQRVLGVDPAKVLLQMATFTKFTNTVNF